jgi:tripartite-type tricarboxylate transporter receptor subunit TctC
MRFFRPLIALALMAAWLSAQAQGTFPTRPITVLHGFAAGGNPDLAAREIAARLANRLGQPVLVENRTGASGTIAASAVARAQPDGHTLLFGVAANLAVAPATRAKPPYDPVQAFTPIIEVAQGPYLWIVRPDFPAQSMREFVAWAKANPRRINLATPGVGSSHHLAAELLQRDTGIELQTVPFTAGMYPALLGSQVDAMVDNLPSPLAHAKAGRLRVLAVTGPRRLALLPHVPTMAEQGLPASDAGFWWGFVGPAGMQPEITMRLNTEIRAILAEQPMQALFAGWGIETTGGSAEAFGRRIAEEFGRWKDVATRAGLRIE